jgi:hypothetical protein
MKVIEYKQTIRTTDVVHIYDEEKNLNWFIAFEKMNGIWHEGSREMMNYDFFKQQGGDYMQKVYDLAYKTVHKANE